MLCKKIELCNFRNTVNESVEFDGGINVLHGENAQGKTNLLEAIYYISLGKSFRTSHESEVIRFGEDFAHVSLDYESAGRDQNITMRFSSMQKKNVTHNGVKISKLSDLVGSFRAVLFCPDHLQMIKEGPALRRNYLDVAISQIRPIYLHSLQKYNKILKQRNQLIKNAAADRATLDSTIDFWSEQLAGEAAVISKFRYEYIAHVARMQSEVLRIGVEVEADACRTLGVSAEILSSSVPEGELLLGMAVEGESLLGFGHAKCAKGNAFDLFCRQFHAYFSHNQTFFLWSSLHYIDILTREEKNVNRCLAFSQGM